MSTIIGQLPGESFEVLYNRIGAIILSDEITSLFIIWGGGGGGGGGGLDVCVFFQRNSQVLYKIGWLPWSYIALHFNYVVKSYTYMYYNIMH